MSLILNRRDFIKVTSTAGAGLIIGFYLPSGAEQLLAQDQAQEFAPNAWLKIDTKGIVTITVAKSDMGQGIRTSLPMIVAEELEADWNNVKVVQAVAHPDKYGSMGTGGSSSIRGSWDRLRGAGASAREMLISAAAETWSVDRITCHAEDGTVIHKPTGKKLEYGKLVEAASKLPVPDNPPLKEKKDYKIVGKWIHQLDTPDKSSGRAKYGIDVRVAGMMYASVVRCPVFGGKVARFDASAAKAIPGVKDVVQISRGVAVVGDSTWTALKGREALKITWDEGPNAAVNSDAIHKMLVEMSGKEGAVAEDTGSHEALASLPHKVEAVYEVPFLAHATMEPMNCVADVKPDGCEIWTGTQSAQSAQNETAETLGLPEEKVKVNVMFLGGGFGRRSTQDFVAEAVEISKAVKAPVRLLWTREDDMQHDLYRPVSRHVLKGGVDAGGKLMVWSHRVVAPSIRNQHSSEQKVMDKSALECAIEMPYSIPNAHVEYVMANTAIPITWWRSVYASQNVFAVESFIDELAIAAKKDPLQFRLHMMDEAPRMARVLETAASKAGWGKKLPKGRGMGIACARSFGSYVAEVADVTVSEGGVKINKVVAAVDCGIAVAPNTLTYNVEGAIVYGLTAALKSRITIDKGQVQQGSFDDYPLLSMDEMPEVEVHLVESGEALGGIGEPGLPPIAPAVCNAIFAASGKRMRELPITV